MPIQAMTDVEMFTEGACGILAREIHDLTGWIVCSFGPSEAYHYFVRLPNGNYLDVRGEQTGEEMHDRWQDEQVKDMFPESLDIQPVRDTFYVGGEIEVFAGSKERARELAPKLIERASDMTEVTAKLLTPGEVAKTFRVTPKTVTRWARSGKLRYVYTLGGHRRYFENDVEELLLGGDDDDS